MNKFWELVPAGRAPSLQSVTVCPRAPAISQRPGLHSSCLRSYCSMRMRPQCSRGSHTSPSCSQHLGGCYLPYREQSSGYLILYFLWFVLHFWAPGPDYILKRPQAKFCFQLQCSCSEGIALTFTAVFWISTLVIKVRIWIIAFFSCHLKKKQVNRFASQCIR